MISHATHFYYDFPPEPDPEERGSYWGTRLLDIKRSMLYSTDDIYRNIDIDRWGNQITEEEICAKPDWCPQLEPEKESNVIGTNYFTRYIYKSTLKLIEQHLLPGIQCQLWSESITTPEHLENMLFPRVLALGERGWTKPEWYNVTNSSLREKYRQEDWQAFANAVGYR